ncbi:MAG TPA: AEC family transporter [Acidimicrobiales bacterium]
MLDVFLEVVLPVPLVAALGGYASRRLGFSLDTLSKAVFYLFSPCLVFTSIAEIEVSGGDIARLVAVTVAVFVANAIVAFAWSTVVRSDRSTRAAAVLQSCVVNQGNMGLPMAALAFGDAGLRIAVVVFVTGVLLWSSAGIALASLARGAHSPRRALLAPLRYPSIYAAVAGALINALDVDLPVAIEASTRTLGDASVPTMLVVLGMQFRWPRLDDVAEPLAASVNRLVIGPLVAWPIAAALGLSGVNARTSIMMAGMPTAVMSTILAIELDARPELVVRTVIASTLLSIASLTVLISILR